jgi:hypothetical protein
MNWHRYRICLANGLTSASALIAAISIPVDMQVFSDMVLYHYPSYRIRFFKN